MNFDVQFCREPDIIKVIKIQGDFVMIRIEFEKELEDLHMELIKMATMVEQSIEKAIEALHTLDKEKAVRILKNDDVIDEQEKVIERKCLNLIARQQPLAKDLRFISTTLKIITDLERIADQSSDIAELTIKMGGQKLIKPLVDIPAMAEKTRRMVKDSINAYVSGNVELAEKVCKDDDIIDDYFTKIILDLVNIMKNDNSTVEQAINLMFVAKYLERMSDHATNISEWVIFNVTGEHIDPTE